MTGLPWENTARFHEAKRKAGSKVRMAAFRTTLPDPLPGEEANVALAADRLAEIVVPPGRVFSMNNTLGPYSAERGYKKGPVYVGSTISTTIGGGVCKIATTLYNAAVLANLAVIARRPHGMLVPYVPPGQDATVSYGEQDFSFSNGTAHPILIWAGTRGNTLEIAFYGYKKPPRVVWHHRILSRQAIPTIKRKGPNPLGKEIPGAEGMAVRTWLSIIDASGKTTTKQLGIDRYRPMPRVVFR